MSKLPAQVDYHIDRVDSRRYKTLTIPLTNNASGSYIASNNSQKLQFQLPSGVVFNPKRSWISYNINAALLAGNATFVARDSFQICSSLDVTTALGVTIAKISNCAKFTKIADKYYGKMEDFITRSALDMQYPTNDVVANNVVPTYAVPANLYGLPAGGNGGLVPFKEPKYFINGAMATDFKAAFAMKLGDIGHSTILEQDKDIYFKETVYLNLMTAPVDSFAFNSTSIAIPTGGTSLAAGALVVSNIQLNLAVEDNAVLANSVIEKFNTSGFRLRVDYVDTVTTPINSTQAQVNINVPQLAGTKLKRIINSVFNATESGMTSQDCSNFAGVAGAAPCKILSYQTVMDSQPLQNNIVDCSFSDGLHVGNNDYSENESFIQGSVVNGLGMYMYNWVHIDDFAGDDSMISSYELTNHDTGLPLDVSHSYILRLKTPNAVATALTLYSFIVTSRILHFGPQNVTWEV